MYWMEYTFSFPLPKLCAVIHTGGDVITNCTTNHIQHTSMTRAIAASYQNLWLAQVLILHHLLLINSTQYNLLWLHLQLANHHQWITCLWSSGGDWWWWGMFCLSPLTHLSGHGSLVHRLKTKSAWSSCRQPLWNHHCAGTWLGVYIPLKQTVMENRRFDARVEKWEKRAWWWRTAASTIESWEREGVVMEKCCFTIKSRRLVGRSSLSQVTGSSPLPPTGDSPA